MTINRYSYVYSGNDAYLIDRSEIKAKYLLLRATGVFSSRLCSTHCKRTEENSDSSMDFSPTGRSTDSVPGTWRTPKVI